MDTSYDNDGKTFDALALNAAINHELSPSLHGALYCG